MSVSASSPDARTREPTPPLSLLFGYGPALLLLLLGIAAWLLPLSIGAPTASGLPINPQAVAVAIGWLFGSAILLFLAGVTRGLSFFSPGGPHAAQMVQMLWLFLLGFGSLASPFWIGFSLLILGYGSIGVFDPQAARVGLAPGFFAHLRPRQMAVFVAGLALLLLRALHG